MEEFSFRSLMIVATVAWIVPIVVTRLRFIRVPAVTMEILAGILIGKSGFNLIQSGEYLQFLSLSGFIMLMFLSGLEVDFPYLIHTFPRRGLKLSTYFRNPIVVGLTLFLLSYSLAFLFSLILVQIFSISHPWFFALVLSTTSVGIVMPILKERGELNTRYGQFIITSAVVADIISIFLITLSAIVYVRGFGLEMVLVLLLFPGFYLLYLLGEYLAGQTRLQNLLNELSHASSQIKVRGTILLILAFLVLSELVGAELILGAFFAGLILSNFISRERSSLLIKLDGMAYGFFIPVFFIMVGANLDISTLAEIQDTFLLLLVLLLAAFAIKVIPSLLLKRPFGWRRAIAAGFLLSSRLSLIIAAVEIGGKLELIPADVSTAVILLAWFSCIFSPFIYNRLNPRTIRKTGLVVIVGAGKIGRALAQRLRMHGVAHLLLDNDPGAVEKARNLGLNCELRDGTDQSTYEKIDPGVKNSFVVVTGSDEINLKIASLLKNRFPASKVIARDNNPATAELLRKNGVVPMNLVFSSAVTLENLLLRPTTYSTLIESFENYEVKEILVNNSAVIGRQVRELPLPLEGFIIIVNREGMLYIPHGNTVLRSGDLLTVFGTRSAIKRFQEIFSEN